MSTQSEHNTPMTRRVALKELVPASSEESEIQCSVSSDTPTEISIPENQEQCEETYTPESSENSEHFKPEYANNGTFYHRGTNAFSQSQISESEVVGQTIRYSGEDYLLGIPTRDDLVGENDGEGLTAIFEDRLSKQQGIPFMAIDNEGSTEKINGNYSYVLRLYGSLINGQKAVVILMGIRVFFDILVPDSDFPDECESKIRDIISGSVKSFRIDHIKAFPFRGYNTEKKPYIRIYTNGIGARRKAIKVVQDNNFETASDDIYSFYRKVTRENGIQLSGWSMLSKYIYKKGTDPLCPHIFHISKKEFHPVKKFTTITDHFPLSALTRDRTLVLTWDIETHASQGADEFAEVFDKRNNVFMICMTLHWKDDPKPLKQICLVDLETAPDPRWITIICENQTNLLKAFALCWQAFTPDIQLGFNDSDYDWRFVIERAYHLNVLEWMWKQMTGNFKPKEEILKWNYCGKIGAKSENNFQKKGEEEDAIDTEEEDEKEYMGGPIKVKLTAGDYFTSTVLKLPGCIPIDVRVCFKKLYPRSEKSSLKFFLEESGLDSKADMPHENMWRIYSDAKEHSFVSTAKNMYKVANYYVIDALRCQELMHQ
ncbi:hypothetical protein Glove_219g179 [Diversispora epigaea]|uniref:DNA-directed DNA polymerase family B exonuclease domain-containing protein n=1 Tax=Diversispora epigaea TaxID=1348612 RepID=A0A397IIS7_9GLOM|nr:hypothetical protein Glove_219g179 [Diversispora epigaea]